LQIKTDRLIIRPFKAEDLESFEKLLTIPELPGWQKQQDHSREFLNWHISNYNKMDILCGTVCFGIFNNENTQIFGAVGAGNHDDLSETEIFYQLLPSARGLGYATESAQAFTKWALEYFNLRYIIGTVGVENLASQKVLEKCGYIFIEEKTLLVHITSQEHLFKYYRRYNDRLQKGSA